jgi:hypothetical protein
MSMMTGRWQRIHIGEHDVNDACLYPYPRLSLQGTQERLLAVSFLFVSFKVMRQPQDYRLPALAGTSFSEWFAIGCHI